MVAPCCCESGKRGRLNTQGGGVFRRVAERTTRNLKELPFVMRWMRFSVEMKHPIAATWAHRTATALHITATQLTRASSA